VQSEETRKHLRDAHQRVVSVAAVQQQLLASSHGDPVYISPYLSRLSQALAASMSDDSRPISLEIKAEGGTASSAEAVSIGLIVAELVTNAFKHAFVGDAAADLVVVAYEAADTSWRLVVSDNGVGTPEGQLDSDKPRPALGTIIVAALAKQLDAPWKSRGANAARRCRSPMEPQIAPGSRSRVPGHACRQSQTAIPFNIHQDAVRVESPLTEKSAVAKGFEPSHLELSNCEQTQMPMSAAYIGCRALEGFILKTDHSGDTPLAIWSHHPQIQIHTSINDQGANA
jgi:two-component sensor histidine kinase